MNKISAIMDILFTKEGYIINTDNGTRMKGMTLNVVESYLEITHSMVEEFDEKFVLDLVKGEFEDDKKKRDKAREEVLKKLGIEGYLEDE